MRQAVVRLRDLECAVDDDLLHRLHAAGLEEVEVLSCDGEEGVLRVRTDDDLDGRIDDCPSVRWYESVPHEGPGRTYLVAFDTDRLAAWLDALDLPDVRDGLRDDRDDCVVFGSLDVDDDGLLFDLAGSQERIGQVVAVFDALGMDLELEELRDYRVEARPLDGLTPRQREVLEVAYREGYFEVPRSASLADVAVSLDLDRSTVSEHLQRAERNLLADLLGE